MKRLLHLMIVALLVTLLSCEKETNLSNDEVSMEEHAGEFKKEIIVSDESGENSVFIVIYSKFESAIDDYMASTKLELIIEDKNTIDLLINAPDFDTNSLKTAEQQPKIEEEHSVTLDIVKTNLKSSVSGYSLQVESKKNLNKSANFQYGTYSDYSSSSDFVGVVHRGKGYNIWVTLNYKKNWGIRNWRNICTGYLDPSYAYFAKGQTYDTHKTGAGVYLDARQSSVNYVVTFSADNFYSQTCEIGSYDYNNYGECYVGSAPVGTRAFIWGPNSNALNFYYTPVNGNQCPRAGSWFDGANCFVMDIPSGCEAYTWQRNWLVKSKLINNHGGCLLILTASIIKII